jgi:hypothetical protein
MLGDVWFICPGECHEDVVAGEGIGVCSNLTCAPLPIEEFAIAAAAAAIMLA